METTEGGGGIVFVESDGEQTRVTQEISITVYDIFEKFPLPALESQHEINEALEKSQVIFSELAALYLALREVPEQSHITIVHDNEGTGGWMAEGWNLESEVVKAIIPPCRRLERERKFTFNISSPKGCFINISRAKRVCGIYRASRRVSEGGSKIDRCVGGCVKERDLR